VCAICCLLLCVTFYARFILPDFLLIPTTTLMFISFVLLKYIYVILCQKILTMFLITSPLRQNCRHSCPNFSIKRGSGTPIRFYYKICSPLLVASNLLIKREPFIKIILAFSYIFFDISSKNF